MTHPNLMMHGTFAANLRDGISTWWYNLPYEKRKSMGSLRAKINNVHIPKEYLGSIIEMFDFRKYDRIKDPIEELLYDYVIGKIVAE